MTKPLSEEQTLLITGAGMSKPLGLPTTKGLYDALRELMDIGYAQKPRRIAERLKVIDKEVFELDDVAKNDIINTLSMLHDGDGATREKEAAEVVDSAKDKYFKLYENYFPGVKMPVLRRHFSSYTRTYDWLSLKSIAHSMYNSRRHIDSSIDKEHEDDGDGFNLVDILTTIQNSIFDNITITTKEIFPKETEDTTGIYYCDRTRLEGALNIYRLLVYKFFKHRLRMRHGKDESNIDYFERFFREVAQDFSGLEMLDDPKEGHKRENYLSNIAYLTYNWDPILPFLGMKVNAKINKSLYAESHDGIWKKVYFEFGVPFSGVALNGEHEDTPIFIMGEESAFQINSFTKDSYTKLNKVKSMIMIKIIKAFVPHGLVNIRICPRCQNGVFIYSKILGDFDFKEISHLMATDPIPSEYDMEFIKTKQYEKVYKSFLKGEPDEIECPKCKHPIYFEHVFMEIQTIVKPDKPSCVNQIKFDYGEFFSKANHILALGYTFPKDDIINGCFIKTMKLRNDNGGTDSKLSFMGKPIDVLSNKPWHNFETINNFVTDKNDNDLKETLDVVSQLFDRSNMRFNFMGFPNILSNLKTREILKYENP